MPARGGVAAVQQMQEAFAAQLDLVRRRAFDAQPPQAKPVGQGERPVATT